MKKIYRPKTYKGQFRESIMSPNHLLKTKKRQLMPTWNWRIHKKSFRVHMIQVMCLFPPFWMSLFKKRKHISNHELQTKSRLNRFEMYRRKVLGSNIISTEKRIKKKKKRCQATTLRSNIISTESREDGPSHFKLVNKWKKQHDLQFSLQRLENHT